MIARLAYSDERISICRRHYETGDSPRGALGPVEDARDRLPCVVCDAERAAGERAERPRAGLVDAQMLAIEDAHGNVLAVVSDAAVGVVGGARRAAQSWADRLREPVWLVDPDGSTERVDPDT